MADMSKLDYFIPHYLKQGGDLKDKCIQRWHLATDLLASGVYASGIFDFIKIDGPTTSGYVLTTDSEGWGTWQPASGATGSTTFLGLTDTPSSYSGYSASGVRVSAGETGLEFYPTSEGGGGVTTFLGLTDTPSTYSGFSSSGVRVNTNSDALEFYDMTYFSNVPETLQTVTDRGNTTTNDMIGYGQLGLGNEATLTGGYANETLVIKQTNSGANPASIDAELHCAPSVSSSYGLGIYSSVDNLAASSTSLSHIDMYGMYTDVAHRSLIKGSYMYGQYAYVHNESASGCQGLRGIQYIVENNAGTCDQAFGIYAQFSCYENTAVITSGTGLVLDGPFIAFNGKVVNYTGASIGAPFYYSPSNPSGCSNYVGVHIDAGTGRDSNITLRAGTPSGVYTSGNWGILCANYKSYFQSSISASGFFSTVPSGVQPFPTYSPTLNTNLNSDMLDGYHASDFWKKSDTVTAGDADTLDGYHGTHYNPMTALGDIIYGGAAGDPQRLPAGAQYTVLHGGTTPSWSQVVELDIALSDNTTNNVSAAKHGFAPILPANSNLFLDGQGNWSTPAGGEVDNYSLTAFSGQTSVNIAHGFGSYPVVQVIDNTGAMLVPQSVTHNSLNDFTVTFNTATSGNIMATIGGPQSYSVKKVSSNYTVLRTDKNVQATASGITITLPWASGVSGFEFRIDNESTGEIYLMSGSGYIQHELSQTIPTDSCLMTYSDGTNWRIT